MSTQREERVVPEPWADCVLRGLTASSEGSVASGAAAPPGWTPQSPPDVEHGPAPSPGVLAPRTALPRDLDEQLLAVLRPARRGDGVVGRTGRWVEALLGGAAERQRTLADVTEGLRRPVSTGRRIAVLGTGGGGGTTTVAALLAAAYAQRRSDPVLAVDAVPDLGWLAWRLGVAPRDRRDLEAAAGPLLTAPTTAYEQLAVLPKTAAGLRVLPSPRSDGAVTVERVMALVGRHFAVTVLDGGVWSTRGAALGANVPLLVARASPDGVRRTVAALAAGMGRLPAPPVLLVSHHPDDEGVHVGAALSLLRGTGARAFALPFDRHLAAGGPIDPGRLAERTVLCVSALATTLLGWSLDGGPTTGPPHRDDR